MKKKILLFVLFPMLIQICYSQEHSRQDTTYKQKYQTSDSVKIQEQRHEINVWVSGGSSSLRYSPTVGEYKPGYGGGVGIGYTYLFRPKWGLSTGLELSIYHAKTTITDHYDNYPAIDDEDQYNQLILMADIDRFEEKQEAWYLNIPLMLQYQMKGEEGNKFYAALGGKLGIPMKGRFQSTGDYLTRGKYRFTQDIFENMPEHGYTFYEGLKADEKLKLDFNFQLSAEAGYKWQLRDNCYLYTGAYCDLGLNDIRKVKNNPYNVLQYNRDNPIKYIINSMTESHYDNEVKISRYINKMNTLSFGVKVKVAFKMD